MIGRVLFSLLAVALIAAKPAPAPEPKPAMLNVIAPQEVANDPSNRLTLELSSGGSVVVMLRPDAAPSHVERIKTLVRQGFYNGLTFHRVVPGFMAQGGDPKGTGQGGSELPDLKAEFNTLPFLRGTFGAARAEAKDSANSQFFIMLGPNATLNNNYTVMGRVIEGMPAVDAIAPGEPPAEPTKIVRASLGG
jgi:cyclophilin family peptidyl-prolyl cis-trans isomerase